MPAKEEQGGGGLSSALGKLGGLAGLAGINLPMGGSGVTQQALEVLKSRGFLVEFITARNLLPVLFAEDWDAQAKRWKVADVPTLDDGVEEFRRDILNVEDKGGTIRIAVDWKDREVAADWANALVAALNERMRQRAIEESGRSLEYLEKQLAVTSTLEVRQSLYRLIEEQLNRSTLANVRKEYVFEVLDAATPSDADRPRWPRKVVVLPLGFFAGLALAALAIALRAGASRPSRAASIR